ncbi:hypothetical protein DYB30_008996 [Aphanomyces astaci]|uniref:Uncharacterized protein n=1 Tax=Aphanomyces astaci TaxID=112090 RepID=A0A397DVM1_APHAT|nr:hypothetical protein DYB30_008996 [Aphanomyces astaci]
MSATPEHRGHALPSVCHNAPRHQDSTEVTTPCCREMCLGQLMLHEPQPPNGIRSAHELAGVGVGYYDAPLQDEPPTGDAVSPRLKLARLNMCDRDFSRRLCLHLAELTDAGPCVPPPERSANSPMPPTEVQASTRVGSGDDMDPVPPRLRQPGASKERVGRVLCLNAMAKLLPSPKPPPQKWHATTVSPEPIDGVAVVDSDAHDGAPCPPMALQHVAIPPHQRLAQLHTRCLI